MRSGAALAGSRASATAPVGQWLTQTPQPMHACTSNAGRRSKVTAANGQMAAQVPQPRQWTASSVATYPEEMSMGVPERCALMAPQQHEQQLQMA